MDWFLHQKDLLHERTKLNHFLSFKLQSRTEAELLEVMQVRVEIGNCKFLMITAK